MEITIALALSILGSVISVSTFVTNRKDKAIKDTKENSLELIKYRLDELDKNVQRLLDKLEKYDNEIDVKVEKAIQHHVALYHERRKREE